MIAVFDGVFRKGIGCLVGRLFLAGAACLVTVGIGLAAPAPGVSDWRTASGAMVTDESAESVMVQAAAPDPNTQRLVFRFPAVVLKRGTDGLLDVSLPSTGQWRHSGEPILPMLSTRVALPQGHELVSFTVVPSDASETVLDAPVRHAQKPYPLNLPQDRVETPASPAIYGADSPYPAALHTAGSVQTKRGVGFVDLALFPVSYRPASGRLTAYGTLTLQVVTQPAPDPGIALNAADGGWRARLRSTDDLAAVQPLIENPAVLSAYQPEITVDSQGSAISLSGDEPSLPCRLADQFKHVIITTRNIRDGNMDGGLALAATNSGHGYLFIVPDPGSGWKLDMITNSLAAAGGYNVIPESAAEVAFLEGMRLALGLEPGDFLYRFEFDEPLIDDTPPNGTPDWLEILDAVDEPVIDRVPFRFTYSVFTNKPLDAIVAMRQAQGLSSTVVSMESILENYPDQGAYWDDGASAVVLRTFLRDAYDKWGTEYVLLVGDGQVMPMRKLFADLLSLVKDELPSDLYFQCLDGSFNSNNNRLWGELNDGADRIDGRPGEDIDLYAELAIGRIPVPDAIAMSNWVAKAVVYETDRTNTNGVAPYLRGSLMLGEFLWQGGIADYAAPMMEEIRLGSSEHGYRTEGFARIDAYTNNVTLYDQFPFFWTKQTAAAYINSNVFSVVNHHGRDSDINYNMRLFSVDVPLLLTNQKPAFLYTQAALAGAFDTNCIAAAFLGGGTNAFFGGVFNSRTGWGYYNTTDGPSQRYNRWFWHTFFGEQIPVTGILNQRAHERNAARINEEGMRWCYYASNLLGDPAQWLYGVERSVKLDRDAYRSGGQAIIDVVLPMAGPAITEVPVTVTLYDAPDLMNVITNFIVICPRVGPSDLTAHFRSAPIDLALLGAVDGGRLRAEADLTVDGVTLFRWDEAPIDDVPPAMTTNWFTADETFIDFFFTTDEPVTSEARIGDTIPLDTDWQTVSATRTTNHTIRFTGLQPFTEYFIAVRMEDAVGNVTRYPTNVFSDLSEDYFVAATIGRETTRRFDWNQSIDGWSVTNLNGGACWEYGQPLTYGPQDDSRCWGTILNGRYPSGANALLTSPPFGVRGRPLLSFRHWVDMQYSMLMDEVAPSPAPFGDYGQIEVLSSGVWYNVTAYIEVTSTTYILQVNANTNTLITRQSEGWQDVRVNLPANFANQALSVRFRFESDQQSFGSGNPAGWYIDDLAVQDVPGSGLGIPQVDVDDRSGQSGVTNLVGDSDFVAESGETVALRPYLFNYGTNTFGNLSGSLTVQIGGYPTTNAFLVDGSPAAVSYTGPITNRTLVPADGWVRLRLAPNLAPGTVVTLLQSVTNAAGQRFDSLYDLAIDTIVAIGGRVVSADDGTPIADATVSAVLDDWQANQATDADGRFTINGLRPALAYRVTAGKPGYSSQTQTVTPPATNPPATNLLFTLGFPVSSHSLTNLAFLALVGTQDPGEQRLVFSNEFTATAPLNVHLERIDYHPSANGWLSVMPASLQLAPGGVGTMTVTASALNLRAGQYVAELVFSTDDRDHLEIRVPVQFKVWRDPDLVPGGTLIEDDPDYHISGNDNGILDPGETAGVWVYLNNTSGMSDAVDVVGTLTTTNGNVTINPASNTLHWPYIAPYSSRLSTNGVEVVVNPGTVPGEIIDFDIELVYFDGLVWQTNLVSFAYEYRVHHSVSGVVSGVIWDEDLGVTNGTAPVAGARVTAEDVSGRVYWSIPSRDDGVYIMPPLPAGDFWFKVYKPRRSSYVEPAGTNILVNMDVEPDFLLNNYGTNAPLLLLTGIELTESDAFSGSDGDGAIEAGDSFGIGARIYNEGARGAANVTNLLSLADMGISRPSFMDIDQDSTGMTLAVPRTNTVSFTNFYATVTNTATTGDKQRFWLTVNDGLREWPFDFAVTVESRLSITGRVTYEDNSGAAAVAVRAERPGQAPVVVTTDTNGVYLIKGFALGATNVTISVTPPGDYRVTPSSLTFGPIMANVTGADFVLLASRLSITPSPLSAPVKEGESTNAWITITNGGGTNVTVDLSVNYARGENDVLSPPVDPLVNILSGNSLDGAPLSPDDFVDGEFEVRFTDGTSWIEREAILKRHGLRAIFHLKLVPACLAVPIETTTLADGKKLDLAVLAQSISSDPGVLYMQPAARMEPQALPNDSLFTNLYGLVNNRQTGGTLGADINVQGAWERTTGSRKIVVAVCDTGFDLTHPDLLPNLWRNPNEKPGVVTVATITNRDEWISQPGYPGYAGLEGVDDDGDSERQKYHFDSVQGVTNGPEMVSDLLFDPGMWEDNWTRDNTPGKPGEYRWVLGPNNIPDFFERYLNGELLFSDLAITHPDHFGDDNGNGIPNVFEDVHGNRTNDPPDGIPDIFADEDGDGIINETGIDFRDEDVMMADYNNNGKRLINQTFVGMKWIGAQSFTVLLEQWDVEPMVDLDTGNLLPSGRDLALHDDDENGCANDLNGWNFYHWDADVTDGDYGASHGTHVSGTIGAVGNNSIGVAGVNWEVSIMPLPLTSRGGLLYFTSSARIAKAIEYAITHGARVSNHSWGGGAASGVLYEIMKLAERDYNHLFVIAAGNSANDVDNRKAYPAYFSTVLNNVITVAATDHHDQLATFSNYGRNSVQLAAPGVDIYSTSSSKNISREKLATGEQIEENGAYYRRLSGTSMAAPHVTGAAALLWSLSPDANYSVIRRALLDGVRKSPNLEGWIQTGGSLDLGRSIRVMGSEWLAFGTNSIEIPAGESRLVEVIFNPELNTPPGIFTAEIVADSAEGRARLPVTLTVLGRPVLEVESIRITADNDSDGFADPGETVSFRVTIDNPGNFTLINLAGTLSMSTNTPPGTTITTATANWDYLYERSSGESLTAFTVTIPPGAPAETLFTLTLTADDIGAQTLTVALPTQERHAVDGRVVNGLGTGVEGVMVEYRGVGSGTVLSGANGDFRLPGLVAGDYLLRAIPAQYTRSVDVPVTIDGSDETGIILAVGAPVVALSHTNVHANMVNDMNWMATVTVSNTALDAFAYALEVMPRRRIGLFADGTSLGVLVAPLRRMGFEVDYYTNNFATVVVYPARQEEIVQDVRYTDDDATVFAYDMVIADLTGPHGGGRVFSDIEADVFGRYLDLGGTVLFTGGNPLNIPDNAAMAALCGVALDKATNRVNTAQAVADWNGAFVTLDAGDSLSVKPFVYDLATPTNLATEVLFTAGAASKLTRLENIGSKGTGTAMLWSGNPQAADWQQEGAWLDILRDSLRGRFMQPMDTQTSVPWLAASPVTGSVAGGAMNLAVTLSSSWLAPDTYRAVILLRGLDRGEEVLALPVSLTVAPHMLRAYTSTGVKDLQGNWLPGNGSDSSPLYQVIYAGTNGVADPPDTASGLTSGDDRLLAVIPSGRAFGRFGSGQGVPPNMGRFDQRFINSMPTNNVRVYVRAWDGASFASAHTYGDSGVSNVAFSASIAIDFGTWRVDKSISLTLDSNDDSLPDDWIRQYRPDLDPLAMHGPLPFTSVATVFATVNKLSDAEQPPQPYRVRLSQDGALMFVLDMANNRIVLMPTNAPATRVYFGGSGTANGKFAQPEGLAVDPRAGHYRLAVADTGNNRIQLFTYNPTNGVLTFERAVGTLGSGVSQFKSPGGVAFDTGGRVFVADTMNNRVAYFRVSDGSWFGDFKGTGADILKEPRGIAFDTHISDGGIWVCDTANNRMILFNTAGTAIRSFGAQGTGAGRFNTPVDVRIWRVGLRRRLVVADKTNGRVQIFATDGTHLATAGTGGSLVGQLSLPHGVEPINNSADLFVADTGNARIQRFSLKLDADGDGMDDFWEDLNGLDSTINDADGDLDVDGLKNIAEYLIGTNPNNGDTNGDGMDDGAAVQAGLDPLATGLPPFQIESLQLNSGGGGGLVIEWASINGAVYQIETNGSLLSGIWGIYTNVIGTGGTSSSELPPPGSTFLFFRMKRIQ